MRGHPQVLALHKGHMQLLTLGDIHSSLHEGAYKESSHMKAQKIKKNPYVGGHTKTPHYEKHIQLLNYMKGHTLLHSWEANIGQYTLHQPRLVHTLST